MENQLTPGSSMILEIRELLENARKNVAQQVNSQLLTTYWNIGRIIVEYEQQNQIRADYGKQTLRELSKELTREFGKGFSRSNLQNMRAFYLAYEKCQTVSGKLSWSHYCELLSITDENKRSFYEKESINSGWSVRELNGRLTARCMNGCYFPAEMRIKKRFFLWLSKGLRSASQLTSSVIPMCLSFWVCRRTSPCWKAIWKRLLSHRLKSFFWNLGEASCLSEPSSA